jgi:hypothetical protein
MQTTTPPTESSQPRLRALIELHDGELKIFPIAETDEQAEEILNSLLLWKANEVRGR